MNKHIYPGYLGRDSDGVYRRKLDEGLLKLTEAYWRRARAHKKGADIFTANRTLLLKLVEEHRPELHDLPVGSVLLRYFIAERGMSRALFSHIAGFGKSQAGNRRAIREWLGGTCPSLATAVLIELATEGLVPCESWLIGGPELAKSMRGTGKRRAIVGRKVVASRLIKFYHLRQRTSIIRVLKQMARDWAKKGDLDEIRAPEYGALKEYGIVTGAFAPHQRYRREAYEDPSTGEQAKDFRCLLDREGRPVPPGDYDARLERHSLEAARRRQEWHEEVWRKRDSNVAARRERLNRSRRERYAVEHRGAAEEAAAQDAGAGAGAAGEAEPDGAGPD